MTVNNPVNNRTPAIIANKLVGEYRTLDKNIRRVPDGSIVQPIIPSINKTVAVRIGDKFYEAVVCGGKFFDKSKVVNEWKIRLVKRDSTTSMEIPCKMGSFYHFNKMENSKNV
jgi:hypothetical protein